MKKIIRLTESDLVILVKNMIKEINTENSYIDNYKNADSYKTKNTNFFDKSPYSEFTDYGIEFIDSGRKGLYQVLLFKGLIAKFYSFFAQFDDEIKKEIIESLGRVYIEASGEFNRIHFREGIHPYLKGIGLGYIIYEAFIKYLGFASSSESATPDSRKIWKKLLNDPDFHGIVCGDETQGKVLIFDKQYNKDVQNIANEFISGCRGNVNIDDSLSKIYPNIK